MARAAVEVVITQHGFFFTGNAVGAVHMSIYDALQELAQVGASAAASELVIGHGLLTGSLQASIEPRLVKSGRAAVFRGKAAVIQGAKGHEPVRFYGGKIDKKYHYMSHAASAAQSYAGSQASNWASSLMAWLSQL
jgi:hypothetical protein